MQHIAGAGQGARAKLSERVVAHVIDITHIETALGRISSWIISERLKGDKTSVTTETAAKTKNVGSSSSVRTRGWRWTHVRTGTGGRTRDWETILGLGYLSHAGDGSGCWALVRDINLRVPNSAAVVIRSCEICVRDKCQY